MFKFLKQKENITKRQSQLSNLIEILQDGVCITNVSGEIIYLNKAGYSLLEVEKSTDLSTLNFFEDFIMDKIKVEFLKSQIDQQGLVRNYELQLHKVSRDLLEVILTINMIGDFRQQTIGFLFLFKDITELKKIQLQLLQSQKLESIGMMASGIAHDFNNILAAIIPNAELIKFSSKETDENYKRAEIIEKSAHRASDIAQRLLTFTRHKEQQFNESINLNQIINDSIELLKPSISRRVRIQKKIEPNLRLIRGDKAQMQQIVMNLIINAIDAMSDGGTIRLTSENFDVENYYQVGTLDPGEHIRFSIKDSGAGINMDILPKIFDPFFTTKEIGKGTGLGLSVVYGIVKSLKGHIEVFSEIDEGTRFDLFFPADKSFSRAARVAEMQKIEPQNLQILVIDDEDYVLNILGDILEFLGYRVIKKGSGQEAVSFYENHKNEIDFAIIDLKMPKMDGRATSAALKTINPAIKIVFTSGFDDSPMTDEDITGVVGFLKKPYSISQVSKSLKSIFQKE